MYTSPQVPWGEVASRSRATSLTRVRPRFQALAGVGMGVANWHHDQERVKKKKTKVCSTGNTFLSCKRFAHRRAVCTQHIGPQASISSSPPRTCASGMQISAYEELRASARVNLKAEDPSQTLEKVEEEVKKMLPDRDYTDEEMEEQANEPNPLWQIFALVWLLLLPVRYVLYQTCCAVGRTKITRAADVGNMDEEEDEDDDDTMIDGYPIDCGTKTRKFLSMSKAQATTRSRHPHRALEDKGGLYIEPYKLHEDVSPPTLRRRSAVAARPASPLAPAAAPRSFTSAWPSLAVAAACVLCMWSLRSASTISTPRAARTSRSGWGASAATASATATASACRSTSNFSRSPHS